MKRIFICMHYMELGGAERALLGVLEFFTRTNHHVDLFIYSHQGELLPYIPTGINLLPEHPAYAAFERPLKTVLFSKQWKVAASRLWAKLTNWWYNRHLRGENSAIFDEVGRATVRVLPPLKHLGEYDVAISFLTPHYIVRDKVKAKKKIAWIHTDYSTIVVNAQRELPVWQSYDKIVSISADVTKAFLGVFPSLQDKIIEIENPLPEELIREQAEEFDASPEMPGKIKLLSIGRYCTPKNFPGAVAIMAELCKLRDDVIWYIIGYGDGEQEIRDAITRYNMQNKFILLGKKSNPYPYIKACDVYVQPSIYEGKSITVKEAQLLGKPVAVTNYPTAHSQINHGIDGVILPLDTPAETATALKNFLEDKNLIEKLEHLEYTNEVDLSLALL